MLGVNFPLVTKPKLVFVSVNRFGHCIPVNPSHHHSFLGTIGSNGDPDLRAHNSIAITCSSFTGSHSSHSCALLSQASERCLGVSSPTFSTTGKSQSAAPTCTEISEPFQI